MKRAARRFRPGLTGAHLEPRQLLTTLPPGFDESVLVAGLLRPTALDVAPDGRLFIAQQDGEVRVFDAQGQPRPQPFLKLRVNSAGERGLVGIVLDPGFATNGFVYVYWTVPDGDRPHNRISRFTARGDAADPASERVILDLPRVAKAEHAFHNGGAMHFGPDGKLYVAVGDHLSYRNAQRLDSVFGKVLRINPDGSIPTDNPYYSRSTGSLRAIWAYGFRNPFTFDVRQGDGLLLANDVGLDSFEEVNRVVRGGNYGWQTHEGPSGSGDFRRPLYWYTHGDGPNQGCAITGGVFYETAQAQFPSSYFGQYFFGDFCSGWVKVLDPATGRATDFASGLGPGIVDLDVSGDGALLVLTRTEGPAPGGAVRRVRFAPDSTPVITQGPADQLVRAGTAATFRVSAAGQSPLSYQWQRDGVDVPGATGPTYTTSASTLADQGARYRVVVTNGLGQTTSPSATLRVVAARPPAVTWSSPRAGLTYRPGQVITYTASARGAMGGFLPASAFTWQVDLQHNEHRHPLLAPTRGRTRGSFRAANHGSATGRLAYVITLTVTDPETGLTSRVSRTVRRAP